jgi:archaemetzincin
MAAARAEKDRRAELRSSLKKIEPFFVPMGKPGPNDWLATHTEKGQTFDEFLDNAAVDPIDQVRNKIYIQPLGNFTAAQLAVIRDAIEYVNAFYGMPVKLLSAKPFAEVPLSGARVVKYAKKRQIQTGFILNKVLLPALPPDAAALMAFTNEDLFSDPSTNYVFGQASLEDRVGVWSLSRLDDNADSRTFLSRTLKISVHELGHMFGMRHCTKYECVMSGTNDLNETDSHPMDACPECMAKICWISREEPRERYNNLADFCQKHGLKSEAKDFLRKAEAVGQ